MTLPGKAAQKAPYLKRNLAEMSPKQLLLVIFSAKTDKTSNSAPTSNPAGRRKLRFSGIIKTAKLS